MEVQLDIYRNLDTVTGGGVLENTIFIATEQLAYNNTNTVNWEDSSTFNLYTLGYGKSANAFAWFKDPKTLHIGNVVAMQSDWKQIRIRKIYGIK